MVYPRKAFRTLTMALLATLALAGGGRLRAEAAPAENLALRKPSSMSSEAYHAPASGGNDGIINGRFAFHTEGEAHPSGASACSGPRRQAALIGRWG